MKNDRNVLISGFLGLNVKKGGYVMSTREYVVQLVSALSDEQINSFVNLIKSFSDRSTLARIESIQLANDPTPKIYSSFKEFMDEAENADGE